MQKLFQIILILAFTLYAPYVIPGNTQTTPAKQTKRTISELLSDDNPESNTLIKNYFLQNKQFIHYRSTEEIKNKQNTPIGLPIYLALLHNNYEMINWLLDKGAELNHDIFLTLFLQKAIKNKTHFFEKHLALTLKAKPEIITQKMLFYDKKLTPLQYAKNSDNQKAVNLMATIQKEFYKNK
jgi:hypothetical protein